MPFVLPSCRSCSSDHGGYFREAEAHGIERLAPCRPRTTTPQPFHFDGLGAVRSRSRRSRRSRRRKRLARAAAAAPEPEDPPDDEVDLLQTLLRLSGIVALQALGGELKSLQDALQVPKKCDFHTAPARPRGAGNRYAALPPRAAAPPTKAPLSLRLRDAAIYPVAKIGAKWIPGGCRGGDCLVANSPQERNTTLTGV